MAVMCFYDFNIVTMTQHFRCCLKQFERQIHANTHIRCKYDTDFLGSNTEKCFLLSVKACCTYDDIHAKLLAYFKMKQCTFRACEIDQYICISQSSLHIGT